MSGSGAEHVFRASLRWTGNTGAGTADYRAYGRSHEILGPGKPAIPSSSDPRFRGEAGRWNPEEMLVASLSSCHMLWYLHLCADAGVVVTAYEDHADGAMAIHADGGGEFVRVTLRPHVTLAPDSDAALATSLHEKAHALCFIARSVKFPVTAEPSVVSG